MTPCNPHAVYTGGSFLYSKGGVKEMKLEEKLTSLRKEKGLTQLELAEPDLRRNRGRSAQ